MTAPRIVVDRHTFMLLNFDVRSARRALIDVQRELAGLPWWRPIRRRRLEATRDDIEQTLSESADARLNLLSTDDEGFAYLRAVATRSAGHGDLEVDRDGVVLEPRARRLYPPETEVPAGPTVVIRTGAR